ncbi:hypothetical protein ARGLB_064_00270 [Arthrobacter globiformis NBRC 12137]|uniref:Uncharacterized protein n=1 Tax=Arthrobacter globiformis (strain ATCC 8010 / DSM 20124 / JCM 1332 / NBRC 12137 / NCIMB 8907 / NRRL B-2979 / 168) TaxID=1077972 RepID=H0QN64_ARTG1|nr:hypothetical protein ARGLB_064_00270 [Arthrobacter globiformis NBRC 12137]
MLISRTRVVHPVGRFRVRALAVLHAVRAGVGQFDCVLAGAFSGECLYKNPE